MVRRLICMLLCMTVICAVASCGFDPGRKVKHVQYYNYQGPVMKYISGLDDYESIEYEAVTVTTAVSMGPHEPTYRGVIELDDDLASEIWNKYDWEEADVAAFDFEKIDAGDLNSDTWYYSEAFAKDTIKYERVDYIYFNGSSVVFSFKSS